MNVLDSNEPSNVQHSNGKCNIRIFFIYLISWPKHKLCSPITLHMYSRASEKGPLYYIITAFSLKDQCLHYMYYR